MIRRPVVGRRDLAVFFEAYPDAPKEALAGLFGFSATPPPQPPPTVQRETAPLRPEQEEPRPTPPPPVSAPNAEFRLLMPIRAERIRGKGQDARKALLGAFQDVEPLRDEAFAARPLALPAKAPLRPWARLWPYLRRVLGARRETRRVDLRRLVHRVAAGAGVRSVPYRWHTGWARRARVVVDRRQALSLFWEDYDQVWRGLTRLRGRDGLEWRILEDGLPPDDPVETGLPVLVLGELGQLTRDPRVEQAWCDYGRRLKTKGAGLHAALLPCPRQRWSQRLSEAWSLACWDRGARLRYSRSGCAESAPTWEASARANLDELLDLLAPLLRVESGLLRSLRLLIPGLDVGAEFDAWWHRDADRDLLAMGLLPEAAQGRRAALTQHPERARRLEEVASLSDRWHMRCSATLQAREVLNLSRCGAGLPAEQVQAATVVLRSALARFLGLASAEAGAEEARRLGFFIFQDREFLRASAAERAADPCIQAAFALKALWSGRQQCAVPDGIDPSLLAAWMRVFGESKQPQHWKLYLMRANGEPRGARILVAEPGLPGSARFSGRELGTAPLVGSFISGSSAILVEVRGDNGERRREVLQTTAVHPAYGIPTDVATIRVLSDHDALELEWRPRPPWARRYARDQFGVFAEFAIEGVTFKLRWIPPGTFTMGSPVTEWGRCDDETQHQVTISRGFWLSEAPCTQAQWSLLSPRNPSKFRGGDHPVDSVGHVEAEEYCQRLAARLEGMADGETVRLPTEAEWEYACRAGVPSAYNDGSDPSPSGGLDIRLEPLGWYGANSGGKTHAVRGKAPNTWGLHDMHGNVWEWCLDRADRSGRLVSETSAEGAVDPCSKSGASWVIRGGGKGNEPRDCRSAVRGTGGGASHGEDQGFRFAIGPMPGSPAAGRLRRTFRVGGVEFVFLWIEPGVFWMGSPEDEAGRWAAEGPRHRVALTQGFWMAETPCTRGQWSAVMGGGADNKSDPQLPMTGVDWEMAVQFAARLGDQVAELRFRLPSEAEWEYACRAGTETAFHDGSSCTEPTGRDPALEKLGWFDRNSGTKLHPVRQKLPNTWGLYDMHGNVWEWCADGKRTYEARPTTNPGGPTGPGAERVFRGGSAWNYAGYCRSASRFADFPGFRFNLLGFRLAAGQVQGAVSPRKQAGGADAPAPEATAGVRGRARRGSPAGPGGDGT